jgi:hypothetical protein
MSLYDWETSGDLPAENCLEDAINNIHSGLKSSLLGEEYNDHVFDILVSSYRIGRNKRYKIDYKFPMIVGNTIYWNKKEKEQDEIAEAQYCAESSEDKY